MTPSERSLQFTGPEERRSLHFLWTRRNTLAQYKEAQHQLDKEEEAKNKTKGRHNPLPDDAH